MHFCILRRNLRWMSNIAGKQFLEKSCRLQRTYPAGKKFHQNGSISHRFRDKYVFAFYKEIQDGHQKWWEIANFK